MTSLLFTIAICLIVSGIGYLTFALIAAILHDDDFWW